MGQIIQCDLEIDVRETWENAHEYMMLSFVKGVRQCLKTGGFTKIENNQEEGGNFLIGYEGNIYEMCSDFQISQVADGLYAIGCGAEYALGAMKAAEGLSPKERCETGLAVAGYFSGGVMEPYLVWSCE